MDTEIKKPWILTSFILKIVALFTMTLDHIGIVLEQYEELSVLVDVFRNLGRLALPLFCFLIVEGVINTKSYGKYSLRLGIMASLVSTVLIVLNFVDSFDGFEVKQFGNIFIDLLLGATAIYCFNKKRVWIKLLGLVPLLISGCSFWASAFECINCDKIVWIYPFFLRTQYGFYSVLMIILIYLGYKLTDLFLNSFGNGAFKNYKNVRIIRNLFAILMIFVSFVVFFLTYQILDSLDLSVTYKMVDLSIQASSLFAGLIILFYNGKRGYNAPWFKYGSYIYYPLHLVIIFVLISILA